MKKLLASLLVGAVMSPLASAASVPTQLPAGNMETVAPATDLTDEEVIQKLYRGAYAFWQQIRNDNGTYLDGYHFERESVRGSIANAGMGLIALTIGHEMGWEPDAEQLALKTLRTMTGRNPDISVPRNKINSYIHFYNTRTGEQIGDDWSPVDSAIMMSGAMFASRYFSDNDEIRELAEEIYNTTDLTHYIASVPNGQIYLATHDDGTPKPNLTKAFNEYMLVASIAKEQARDFGQGRRAPAIRFWNTWYRNTRNVAKPNYNGHEVLGVAPGWFISKFNFLFNNYLIHEYSNSEEYQQYSHNAAAADFSWWQDQTQIDRKDYEWGSGAGACPGTNPVTNAYCVDRILRNGSREKNNDMVVSPHILAGFMPQFERGRDDLVAMYRDEEQKAHYRLEDGSVILWRYSYDHPEWRAKSVQAVDFSTMLFGLAALPENLGMEFFNEHNNYFSDEPASFSRN